MSPDLHKEPWPTESAEELYENAPCGYLSMLPDGTIIRANQTFLTWTGYTRTALLAGKRFQELLTVPGRIFHDTHYSPLLQMQGFVNEIAFDLLCVGRAPLPVLVNSLRQQDATGQPLLIRTTIFDATDRRTYERELLLARRKAEQLAAIVKLSSDAILSMTAEGIVQTWNTGAEQMFGYTASEAIGQAFPQLLYPTAEFATFHQMIAELRVGHTRQAEIILKHKHGQRIDVSLSLTLHPRFPGEPAQISSIIRDITERKQTEVQLRTQAEALARLNAELDNFVYTVSHDLKEPLRGISSYAQFLLEDYGDKLDAAGVEMLQSLPDLTQRLSSFIDALLRYSRLGRQELDVEEVNLQRVLDEQIYLLTPSLAAYGVEIRVPRPLPLAQANPLLIGEVFSNLLINACKYNDKAVKWVEIGYTENQRAGSHEAANRPSHTFYVRDNGIGIPLAQQAVIFRIFRRLHGQDEYGGGIGAGLTIVRKIIERHEGKIWVQSEPGAGTTFYFTLDPNQV